MTVSGPGFRPHLLDGYFNPTLIYMKERGNERCQKKDVIRNYIIPIIGDTKLSEINTRFMEKYYQTLLKTPSVINPIFGKRLNETVGTSTIRDIHKLLRSAFDQAVKWELMEK